MTMRTMLLITAVLGAALACGTGCSNSGSGTGGTAGSTTTSTTGAGGSTTTSTTGAGGSVSGTGGSSGGTGGAGGGMSMGGAGGAGGAGGTGGAGGSTSDLVNGCDAATAEDHTSDATTTVTQSGLHYAPKCIKIAAGASVKFVSSFASHPLVGGTVESGAKVPDASSPITTTSSGTQATFAFPNAGAYGYYCEFHALMGMDGAVFVE